MQQLYSYKYTLANSRTNKNQEQNAIDLLKVEKLTCIVCMQPVFLKSEKTSVNVCEK